MENEAAPMTWEEAVNTPTEAETAPEEGAEGVGPAEGIDTSEANEAEGRVASAIEGGDEQEIKAAILELGDEYDDALVPVKIHGEIRKVPLKELRDNHQLKRVFMKKHEEMVGKLKQHEDLVGHARNIMKATQDERAMAELFRASGLSEQEFARALHEARRLTPEQQVQQRMRAEEERLQKDKARRAEAQAKEQREQEVRQYREKYTAELREEFRAAMESGRVLDAKHWDDTIDVMRRALKSGVEMTFRDAMEIAEQEDAERYTGLYQKKSDDRLIEELTPARILKMAAAITKKKKSKGPAARPKPTRKKGSSTQARRRKNNKPPVFAGDLGPDGWSAYLDGNG